MKTSILSLILTIALLLSAFAGCSSDTETLKDNPDNTPTGTSSDAPETEPDYSWFETPEDTGKLEIYSPGNLYSSLLNPAIEIFKQLYPEIEVSYEILSNEEYETRIRTEIPAGKGPDLVLMTDTTFPDVYKTMQTDLFEDLNPYFGTDEEIALSVFVKPVMDAGLMNGKRVLAPLNYEMSILMTSQSILDELGMTAEELEPVDGFCEGAERFHEKYPDSTLFMDMGGVNPAVGDLLTMYRTFGFNLIDYAKNEISIDETRFRQYIDLVKLYFDPDYDVTDESMWDDEFYTVGHGLTDRRFPYDNSCGASYKSFVNSRTFMANDGEEPVVRAEEPAGRRDGAGPALRGHP